MFSAIETARPDFRPWIGGRICTKGVLFGRLLIAGQVKSTRRKNG